MAERVYKDNNNNAEDSIRIERSRMNASGVIKDPFGHILLVIRLN